MEERGVPRKKMLIKTHKSNFKIGTVLQAETGHSWKPKSVEARLLRIHGSLLNLDMFVKW